MPQIATAAWFIDVTCGSRGGQIDGKGLTILWMKGQLQTVITYGKFYIKITDFTSGRRIYHHETFH